MDDKNKPGKKSAPPLPKSHFERQQMAEDTEREMQGRPQKYGKALPEDDTEENPAAIDNEQAQGGQPTATPEEMGQEPEQPGLEEGMPDPSQANSREEAEAAASAHIAKGNGDKMMASHHGHLHDLHKRLKALEAKSGGQGHEPPSGSGPAPASSQSFGGDEDGY